MSITVRPFGMAAGKEVQLYTLTNASGASVEISNYGGIIRAINVPDRDGKIENVVLGYDSIEGYIPVNGYLGALIGRVGNRICKGKFTLNGVDYQLAVNNGNNHLHGGDVGFNDKIWDAQVLEGICEDNLILKYTSPDGEENYPGTLKVMVTYTFTDDNELVIRYEAVSDKDTLCNLTNHSYFNLSGNCKRKVYDHVIEINADTFTSTDSESIPLGELRPVDGTPFDLRQPVRLGDRLDMTASDEQMTFGQGFDHNFNINDEGLRFGASVTDPESGRILTMFTDQPAVQLYTSNMLVNTKPGSCGRSFEPRDGFCLETQAAPDSINQEAFPDDFVLPAGEKYDFTTIYTFDAE